MFGNYLNGYPPLTGSNLPRTDNFMVIDNSCAGVKGDSWANVPRDAIEAISDLKFVCVRRFDDEMLFAVRECIIIG